MGEIGSGVGVPAFPGSLDTNSTAESASTTAKFEFANDVVDTLVAIETELGIDPAGSLTDVKTFLQTEHNADGTKKASSRFATDTGSADTYAVAPTPAWSAYVKGLFVVFDAGNASTGASTLNVNSLGAKTILKFNDQAIVSGDIEAGQMILAVYDGTNFQMVTVTAQILDAQIVGMGAAKLTGTVADARLTSNIPRKDAETIFSNAEGLGLKAGGDTTGLRIMRASLDRNELRTNDDGTGTQEDSGKPSWAVSIGEGAGDGFVIYRKPPAGSFASLFAMNSAGKQIVGTLTLERLGVAKTFSFVNLANGAGATVTFTHGLGTDNIKILLACGFGSTSYTVNAKRPDGQFTSMSFIDSGAAGTIGFPATPASGEVVVQVQNNAGSTQSFIVKAYILRED